MFESVVLLAAACFRPVIGDWGSVKKERFESVVLLAAVCFRPVIGDLWHLEVGYGLVFLGVRSSYRTFDVWVCGWWSGA